jgi:hypothetical protein
MTTETLEVLVKRDFADKISSNYLVKELTKDFADNKEIVKILTSELNQGGTADFIANMKNYIEFSKEQAPKIDISKALNEKDPDALETKVIQAINHFENALVDKAKEIAKNDPQFSIMETTKNGKPAGFALVSREPNADSTGTISFNKSASDFIMGYIKNNSELLKAVSAQELENGYNQMMYQRYGENLDYISRSVDKSPEIFLQQVLFFRTDLPEKLNEKQLNAIDTMVTLNETGFKSSPDYSVKSMEKPGEHVLKLMSEIKSLIEQEGGAYEKKALINAFAYNKQYNLVSGTYNVSEKINDGSSIEEIRDVATRMVSHFTNDMFTKIKDHVEKHDPEITLDDKNGALVLKVGDTKLDLGKSTIYEVINTLREHDSELKEQISELDINLREKMGIKKPEFDLER